MRGLSHMYARCANRSVKRKAACAMVGAVAATALLPSTAGAQADHRDLFWALTASPVHVAHCVQGTVPEFNANYTVCRVVWPAGMYEYAVGAWVEPWCALTVEPGDGAGVPLRLRWRSVVPGMSCAPGAGVYVWTTGWATATEGYTFPRDAADPWSRSTVVEIM